MISTMVAASLVLLAAAIAPPQEALSKRIDVVLRGAPLSKQLAELSRLSGIPLTCDETLGQEPVLFKVSGVTIGELMQRTAKAMHGKWSEAPKGYVLRLEKDLETIRAEWMAKRAEKLRMSIAKRVEKMEKGAFTEPRIRAAMQAQLRFLIDAQASGGSNPPDIADLMPFERLLIRLVAGLDPAELASMQPGDRLVFSASPTNLQRSFGPSFEENWDDFRSECQQFSRLASDYETLLPAGADGGRYLHLVAPDAIQELLLIVKSSEFQAPTGRMLDISLRGYDRTGSAIEAYNETFGFDYDPSIKASLLNKDGGATIRFGPVGTHSLKSRIARRQRQRTRLQPPPGVLALLLDPVAHDPWSFGPSDCVLDVANARGSNVVAWLRPLLACEQSVEKDGTVRRDHFVGYLNLIDAFDNEESDGWWLLGMKPESVLNPPADLEQLGRLLHFATETDSLTTLQLARMGPVGSESQRLAGYTLNLAGVEPPAGFTDARLARFVTSLDEPQFAALESAGELNGSQLSVSQIDLVYALLNAVQSMNDPFDFAQTPNDRSALRNEVTELFAGQDPADLRVSMASMPYGYVRPPQIFPRAASQFGPDGVALLMYLEEHPEAGNRAYPPMPGAFQTQFGRKLDFSFDFGQGRVLKRTMLDLPVFSWALVPYKDLPEWFRNEVEVQLDRIRKDPPQGS